MNRITLVEIIQDLWVPDLDNDKENSNKIKKIEREGMTPMTLAMAVY